MENEKLELRYPCPCCFYFTFDEPEGSFDICPVCNWEDDEIQLQNLGLSGGANEECLNDARRNFKEFQASSYRFKKVVRQALEDEKRPKQFFWKDKVVVDKLAPSKFNPSALGIIEGVRVIDTTEESKFYEVPLGSSVYLVSFSKGLEVEIPVEYLDCVSKA